MKSSQTDNSVDYLDATDSKHDRSIAVGVGAVFDDGVEGEAGHGIGIDRSQGSRVEDQRRGRLRGSRSIRKRKGHHAQQYSE